MINPKNIVQLLQESFNDPQYDFQSIITDDDKAFAVQLENVIKDADIFFETSSTLCCEDESVIPDPFIVDQDFEDDSEEIINENNKKIIVSIDFEYKKKAVQYWKSAKKGKLKLKTVQNQFKKLKNQNMLYGNHKLKKVETESKNYQKSVSMSLMNFEVHMRSHYQFMI